MAMHGQQQQMGSTSYRLRRSRNSQLHASVACVQQAVLWSKVGTAVKSPVPYSTMCAWKALYNCTSLFFGAARYKQVTPHDLTSPRRRCFSQHTCALPR